MKKPTTLSFWARLGRLIAGDPTPLTIRQRTHHTKARGDWSEWQILKGRTVIDRFASHDDAVAAYPYATTPQD